MAVNVFIITKGASAASVKECTGVSTKVVKLKIGLFYLCIRQKQRLGADHVSVSRKFPLRITQITRDQAYSSDHPSQNVSPGSRYARLVTMPNYKREMLSL